MTASLLLVAAICLTGPAPAGPSEVDVDLLVVPPPDPIPPRPALDIRRHLMPQASIIDAMAKLDEALHASAAEQRALSAALSAVSADLAWREAASREAATRLLTLEASLMRRVGLYQELTRGHTLLTWLGRTPRFSWQDLLDRAGAMRWMAGRLRSEQLAREGLVALTRSFDVDLARRQRNREHIERRLAVLEARASWDADELAALKKAVVEEPGYYAAYARDMETVSGPLGAHIAEALAKAPARPRLILGDGNPRLSSPLRHGDMIASYGPRAYLGVRSVMRATHWALSEDGRRDARRHGVRAAYWGYVLWTGWFKGLGQVVILDHTRGITSVYGHLETIEVKVGERLAPGHRLGTIGETGSFFGRRLHFELRVDGEPENPLPWLK